MTALLVRARLKRTAAIAAIAPLLLPPEASARAAAAHRLIWSLFAEDPEAARDFLWREDAQGTFYILAQRVPAASEIFDVETKEFVPALAAGDMLRFSLRANATRACKAPGAKRGTRADVVMAALKPLSPADRSAQREAVIEEAGAAWLRNQGEKHGFALTTEPRVDGYEQRRIKRAAARDIQFSVLDFDGVLRVTEPEQFLMALAQGFGHAKAFGCGLMLIRRA